MSGTWTTESEAERRISSALLRLPRFGDGPGLHRMRDLAARVASGPWLGSLQSLRVTGSKGKGSTCALIEAILRQLGLRTGFYTSPHLLRFAERLRFDGEPIAVEDLAASRDAVIDACRDYEARFPRDFFGAFEVFTGLALHSFDRQRPDAVVAEAGIGGRLDATRVVPGAVVALTSVELEHAALLGSTPLQIALDKADLCPAGGTLVAGAIDPELVRRLRGACALRSVEVLAVSEIASWSEPRFAEGSMRFELSCEGIDFGDVECRLFGTHQQSNVAVAVAAVKRWLALCGREVETGRLRTAVAQALRAVNWPGRLECVARDPTVIVDVGHTPGSMRCVAETVRRAWPDAPVLLVTGVSQDKDVSGIVRELVPLARSVMCTRSRHRGAPAEDVARACEAVRAGCVAHAGEDARVVLDLARKRAARERMTVLVAGSLYLAVEAAVHVRGGDPAALAFF